MATAPGSAWYAARLRWIASGMLDFADAIDRRAPEPWPLEPAPEHLPVDDYLLDARHRASRVI
jgi:hypothetical protein